MKILVVNSDRSGAEGEPINLGDAMLTEALVEALHQGGHVVTVAEFGDSPRLGGEGRVHVTGVSSLLGAVRSVDAVVVGGGTMLQDDGPALGGLPRLVAVTSVCAWLARRPLAYFGVGCDPVTRFWPRRLLKVALWRRAAWPRDVASVDRCRHLSRSCKAELGADAFLLAESPDRPAGSHRVGAILALAGAEAGDLKDADIDALSRRYGRVRFVAMSQSEPYDDRVGVQGRVTCEIDPGLIHRWQILADDVSKVDVIVASRMHALYLGMSRGARLIAVGEKAKVKAFAHEFGIPLATSVSGASTVEPTTVNVEAFQAARARARAALTDMVAGMSS
jgi:polysaccharide pyruvyl transferase WcaK-like protein